MRGFYHRWGFELPDLPKMKPLPPLSAVAGLGNIFKDAAAAIEEAKHSGQSLSTEAAAFAADVQTVRKHVRREHEDFHFKVSQLGNVGGKASGEVTGSENSSEFPENGEAKTD